MEKSADGVVLVLGFLDDFFDQGLVAEADWASHTVFENGGREAVGEVVFFGSNVLF